VHYGHALEFGTFITPGSGAPETTVSLAKLSEDLGYDLVTFQDHPYRPDPYRGECPQPAAA
jgi:alkanesulfonate monooxygenase SsuD/methylene tetrahydromethanopterin reductase-like flavin-dependent oxidoreductase (luciferase family)